MDLEKLKLITQNLESLVECLKSEIHSYEDSPKEEFKYENIAPYLEDYDEVFYEDDSN